MTGPGFRQAIDAMTSSGVMEFMDILEMDDLAAASAAERRAAVTAHWLDSGALSAPHPIGTF